MALSNMVNEPRREITETVIGLFVVGLLVFGDYQFAVWLVASDPDHIDMIGGMALGIFAGVLLAAVVVALSLALVAIHALDDVLCNVAASFGFDPRPTRRYNRR